MDGRTAMGWMARSMVVWSVLSASAEAQLPHAWTSSYNGPDGLTELGYDLAIGPHGCAHVLGFSETPDGGSLVVSRISPYGQVMWTHRYDGPAGNSWPSGITVDAHGNTLVIGNTQSAVGDSDVVLLSFDSRGGLRWEQRVDHLGGEDYVFGNEALALDASGHIYASLMTWNGGSYDALVVSVGRNGNLRWKDVYDGPSGGNDYGYGIAVHGDDVYAVVDSFDATTDIGVLKYDTNGTREWLRTWDGGMGDLSYSIAADAGAVYVAGISFDSAGYDAVTIKWATDGTLEWANRFDAGNGRQYAFDVEVHEASGHVAVCGSALMYGGDDSALTLRYDADGRELLRHYGEDPQWWGDDSAIQAKFDAAGRLYVTGSQFNGWATSDDAFVTAFNVDGSVAWEQFVDGPVGGDDGAYALEVDPTGGRVWIAGFERSATQRLDLFVTQFGLTPDLHGGHAIQR